MESIGVLLILIGTLSSAVGMFMIRKSEMSSNNHWYFRWMGNILIIVFGSGCGVAALDFIPESVIAPMGSLVVFWTSFLQIWIGETRPDWRATFLVVFGCALVVIAAPRMEPVDAGDPIIEIVFFIGCFYSVVNLLYSMDDFGSINIWIDGIQPGLVAGFSNTCAKACVEGLKQSHPFTVFYGCAGLLFAAVQLVLLNLALKRHSPIHVNSIYQLTTMLSVIGIGGISFGEFQHVTILDGLMFTIGAIMSGVGTWMLSNTIH
jgi:hypothetical protein